jgi:hypothetical protein
MPKLYDYFGLVFLFYSQEHEPIHVHGKYDIVRKWIDFFVYNIEFAPEKITKKL